jgi:hypothetical protein
LRHRPEFWRDVLVAAVVVGVFVVAFIVIGEKLL